jgi:hypothetical protein
MFAWFIRLAGRGIYSLLKSNKYTRSREDLIERKGPMYVVSSWLCVVEVGKITKELITGVFIHERAGYQRIFVIQKLNSEEHMIDNKRAFL